LRRCAAKKVMKPKALMGVASERIKREQKSDWTTPLFNLVATFK
jgi:hypothetical protein